MSYGKFAVYGLPAGESERWKEVILSAQCQSSADVEKIKAAAGADGWHSFRSVELDNEPPNFLKGIA